MFDVDKGPHIAAQGGMFPNGAVITPEGRKLYLSETFADYVSAFYIQPDGTLLNRYVYA